MKSRFLGIIGVFGILFEILGILMLLYYHFAMQTVYSHKTSIDGKKILLMMVPEERTFLYVGFFLTAIGFCFMVSEKIANKEN